MSAPDPKASGAQSYTAAGRHTTAAAIGKEYRHEFPASDNADKRCTRGDDGKLTSGQYVRTSLILADETTPTMLQINYRHPIERWVGTRPFRWLLRRLSVDDAAGSTALERVIASYGDPAASRWTRIKYWLLHRIIDRFRGQTDMETFRQKLAGHRPTLRGLVIVARSVGKFGLTVPQKFVAPLFAVWNFTNRCNLACRHCYQDSDHAALADELTLEEKLALVDQMGRAHMPMLALSGGEPTISPHVIPVLERASSYGMHLTLATNGTTMTPAMAGKLAAAGLRYVEISLDSTDPARHDAFRGQKGMWEKSVAGARVVVATPGLRLGIAMCVHQGNFHEVRDMIAFAEKLGAGCFAHFNFIPVGRGLRMVSGDITPAQREELLAILNEKMQAGGMGVISTAPQLGRVCLAGAALESGRAACSHAGSGSGVKARVVAKYLGGCGAGRTYICIEPNGNVTPCVYLPHRVMGNVREGPLMEIFRTSEFWDILNDRDHRLHHCEVCAFRNYCGGCRARSDAYFGQLHGGDPGCIFNDKHWQALVDSGVAISAGDAGDPQGINLPPMRHGPA
ncbi:MAG: radical SAM protein [Planctomycetaceae bacterium]|nr:radical SAM protein [Planctomycetaceae bacterium]